MNTEESLAYFKKENATLRKQRNEYLSVSLRAEEKQREDRAVLYKRIHQLQEQVKVGALLDLDIYQIYSIRSDLESALDALGNYSKDEEVCYGGDDPGAFSALQFARAMLSANIRSLGRFQNEKGD